MKMNKKIIIACFALATVLFITFRLLSSKNSEEKYRMEKVLKGELVESITATGTVNAITTVNVGTQVSGTIQKLHADFNSRVTRGQVIARIDPTMFEAQVDQAKANLNSAKANLARTEISVIDTKRTMDRNSELLKKNLIAQSDLDTAETNYLTAKSQVDVAKAQVEQMEASLKVAATNLQYTRIVSPVNGIIISRNVDVGQTVAASFQTPTLFMIAEDLTKMQIDSNVNEADIGKIREKQSVTFSVDAYPEFLFKGKVQQIRNAPIIVQNVVTYDVVIFVDNSDMKLKPGMTANASIITNTKSDVLKIPNSALRFKPSGIPDRAQGKEAQKSPAPYGGQSVWILEKNIPKRVRIKTGINDGAFTEVVSGELAEGQELIVDTIGLQKKQAPASGPPRMF